MSIIEAVELAVSYLLEVYLRGFIIPLSSMMKSAIARKSCRYTQEYY